MTSDPNLACAAKNDPESFHRLILDPRPRTTNKPGGRLSEHWRDDLGPSILSGALLAYRRLSRGYGRTESNANSGGGATQQSMHLTHNASYRVIHILDGWSNGQSTVDTTVFTRVRACSSPAARLLQSLETPQGLPIPSDRRGCWFAAHKCYSRTLTSARHTMCANKLRVPATR